MLNLLLNASEAIEGEAGNITVRTRLQELGAAELEADYGGWELETGAYVVLEVEDDGCGMDADTRAPIFEPFYSTKVHGRGLGLSAALGIVRSHHGGLRVVSESGGGARFSVLLPVSRSGANSEVISAGSEERAATGAGGMVLLADDEELVRNVARRMLESLGYEVVSVADGADALAAFEAQPAAIRCALIDVMLPRLTGDQVCARIKSVRPDLPVVLCSGYSEHDVTRQFDETSDSADGFLEKPFNLRQLEAAVRDAIEGRSAAAAAGA